jgi:soluble lytic murein transglycosylase
MSAASKIPSWVLLPVLLAVLAGGFVRALAHHRAHRFDPLIRTASLRYGTDPALVSAVIWKESGYHPDRRGKAGEIGLMQIREPAAREWARAAEIPNFQFDHLLDPGTNIMAGTWYLARALKRWEGRDEPAPYALAEYNAGLTHARRWAAMPGAETGAGFSNAVTFPTTRAYIRDILTRYRNSN